MQVILADAATTPAPADNARGFLGARLDQCEAPGADGVMRPAILVCQRIPGFDAYRMLHNDDVILAVDGSTQETRRAEFYGSGSISLPPANRYPCKFFGGVASSRLPSSSLPARRRRTMRTFPTCWKAARPASSNIGEPFSNPRSGKADEEMRLLAA